MSVFRLFMIRSLLSLLLISNISIIYGYQHNSYYHPTTSSYVYSHKGIKENRCDIHQLLSSSDDDPDLKSIRGMKGFYTRPSKAIEKGGGFFIPGLENGKIRIVSAIFIIFLYAINQFGVTDISNSEKLSTSIGIISSLFLLFQGIVELFVDTRKVSALISNSSSSIGIQSNEFLSVIQRTTSSLTINPSAVSDEDQSMKSINIIDSVARSIIKTCANTNYIAVVTNNKVSSSSSSSSSTVNNNSNTSIIYEIGPISNKPTKPFPMTSNTSVTNEPIVIVKSSINQFQEHFPMLFNGLSSSLPMGTTAVTVITDTVNNFTWVVADNTVSTATAKDITSNSNNNNAIKQQSSQGKSQDWLELLISSTQVQT